MCVTPCSVTVHVVAHHPQVPEDDHGRSGAPGHHGDPRDAGQDAAECRAADHPDRWNARQYPHLYQECSPASCESFDDC